MSDRVFVDTVFVVALINRRDQYHSEASDALTSDQHFVQAGFRALMLE